MSGGAPRGNTNGSKGRPFLMALQKIIAAEDMDPKVKTKRLRAAADQLLAQAARGEEWAIKELANRLDGKAVQGVELSGAGGTSLNLFDAGMLRNMNPDEVAQLRSLLKKAGTTAGAQE